MSTQLKQIIEKYNPKSPDQTKPKVYLSFQAWAFLLGGEAQGWKSDAEVWSSEERQPINITSFPYTIGEIVGEIHNGSVS